MQIAFYKGNSFIGRGIRFFSRGGYSHVAIRLNDGRIIESYPFHGVRIRNSLHEKIRNTQIDVYNIPTTPKQDEIIKSFLANQIGKKYDYRALLGFLFYVTKEKRRQRNKWICSELVFIAFQKAGINLLERVDAWKISPTMLSFNTKMEYDFSILV
jgi:uncharacterized protein YycO